MKTPGRPVTLGAALLLSAAVGLPSAIQAQSVLERTPNVHDGWIGDQVRFHFNHRMSRMEIGDERRLIASPTFLLGVPAHENVLLGVQYASSSEVVESNEWELFVRWAPLTAGEETPFGLALAGGWNTAARSGDGEVSLTVPLANAQLLGTVRTFTEAYDTSDLRFALGGGMLVRVSESVAFAGDVVSLQNRSDGEEVALGAGLQLQIPRSPHTFSIQATNTPSATLQGSSRGNGDVLWGFEFTTPLTFLGGGG